MSKTPSVYGLIAVFALLSLSTPLAASAMSKRGIKPTATAQAKPVPVADADNVWVGKSDEAKSCEKTRGIPIDKAAAELTKKGIKLLAKKKVSDGKMRIQSCGADKGDMNGFLIPRKDLEKAKELGFKTVPSSN